MCINTLTCILFVRRRPSAAERTHPRLQPGVTNEEDEPDSTAFLERALLSVPETTVCVSIPAPAVGGFGWTRNVDCHACRIMLFSVFMISWTTFLRLGMWKNTNVPRNARKEFPAERPSRGLFPKDIAIFGFWFQESFYYSRRPGRQSGCWEQRLWKDPRKGNVWSIKPQKPEVRIWGPEKLLRNLARADEGRSAWGAERSRCFRGHRTAGLKKQQRGEIS